MSYQSISDKNFKIDLDDLLRIDSSYDIVRKIERFPTNLLASDLDKYISVKESYTRLQNNEKVRDKYLFIVSTLLLLQAQQKALSEEKTKQQLFSESFFNRLSALTEGVESD